VFRQNGPAIRVEHQSLILVGNSAGLPVEVIVYRPDGKRRSYDRIEAGGQRRLSGLSAGICILRIKDRSGSRTLTTVMP
jgi:hypothetical protein